MSDSTTETAEDVDANGSEEADSPEATEGTEATADGDVLSKAEVGALLTGVEDGVVPTNQGLRARGEVSTYTFNSSSNVSSYCPAALAKIYTRTARMLKDSLCTLLKRDVSFDVEEIRRYRYDEYLAGLDAPICIQVIRERQLPGSALVVMESGLIYDFVDHYFGGVGEGPADCHAGRSITPAEVVMSAKLLDLVLAKLVDAWSAVTELEFSASGFETDPALVTIAAPSAYMLVAKFNVDLTGTPAGCHIVVPLSMLAPVRSMLAASGQGSLEKRAQFQQAVRRSINSVNVELHSTICQIRMTLRELLSLAPGDLIPIDLPSQVTLQIDSESVLYGRYGRSRGFDAICIEGRSCDQQDATPAEEPS